MTPTEARERMLAALSAAGVNGIDINGEDFLYESAAEHAALLKALHRLAVEGVAVEIGCGWWRLSDQELALRILRAVGFEHAQREDVLIDSVVEILRGSS